MYGFGDIAILHFGFLTWKCLCSPILDGFWGHISPK